MDNDKVLWRLVFNYLSIPVLLSSIGVCRTWRDEGVSLVCSCAFVLQTGKDEVLVSFATGKLLARRPRCVMREYVASNHTFMLTRKGELLDKTRKLLIQLPQEDSYRSAVLLSSGSVCAVQWSNDRFCVVSSSLSTLEHVGRIRLGKCVPMGGDTVASACSWDGAVRIVDCMSDKVEAEFFPPSFHGISKWFAAGVAICGSFVTGVFSPLYLDDGPCLVCSWNWISKALMLCKVIDAPQRAAKWLRNVVSKQHWIVVAMDGFGITCLHRDNGDHLWSTVYTMDKEALQSEAYSVSDIRLFSL